MIVLRYHEGIYRPIILCDICEQPITDVQQANLVSKNPTRDEITVEAVMQVHQGRCTDVAEEKLGGKTETGFDNLEDHLFCLMLSSGLGLERLAELIEIKKETGM